ncbi:MAG: hypothetical protein WC935_04380 [Thermoleophilia bacterium]
MTVLNANYLWLRRKAVVFAPVLFALAVVLLMLAVAAGCGDDSEKVDVATVGDTGGRLQIRETYFDAGTAKTGEKAEHAFELKNTGSGPLNLGQLEVKRLEGC